MTLELTLFAATLEHSSQSDLADIEKKVGAPKVRTVASVIGDHSHLCPPRHLWEGAKDEAGAETVLDAVSWQGVSAISPTAAKSKVSMTISVELIPREPSRTGSAGTPPTAEGGFVCLSMTHRRILETNKRPQCPMSGTTGNSSTKKSQKCTQCAKKNTK
jgi:hypothetical protein